MILFKAQSDFGERSWAWQEGRLQILNNGINNYSP